MTEQLSSIFSQDESIVQQNESAIYQLDASIDDFDTILEEDSIIHQTTIPFEDKKDDDDVKPIMKKRVVISTESLKQEEDVISNELTNEEELDDFDDNLEPSEDLDEQYSSMSFTSQEVFDIQDDDDLNLSQDEDLIQFGQDIPIHPKPSVGADASFVSIDNNQFEEDWGVSMIENADDDNSFKEDNTPKDKVDVSFDYNILHLCICSLILIFTISN